jgi:hypothetical protein
MEGRDGTYLYTTINVSSDDSIDPGGFGDISRDVLIRRSKSMRISVEVTDILRRLIEKTGLFASNK